MSPSTVSPPKRAHWDDGATRRSPPRRPSSSARLHQVDSTGRDVRDESMNEFAGPRSKLTRTKQPPQLPPRTTRANWDFGFESFRRFEAVCREEKMAASARAGERATSYATACSLLSRFVRQNGAAAAELGVSA